MKLNARKQGRKEDPLAKEWQGPFTLIAIEGKGQCTLKAENGHDLKTKVNISQLKPFQSYQTSSQPHTINKASPDTLNAIDLIGISAANCSPSCMTNESTDPPSAVTVTSSTCVSLTSQRVDGDGDDVTITSVTQTESNIYEIRNAHPARKRNKAMTCRKDNIASAVSFGDILAGKMLSNNDINAAQITLKNQYPHVLGLQDTLLGTTLTYAVMPVEMLQILHDGSLHWLLISTIGCTEGNVNIYDSLKIGATAVNVQLQIASLLCSQQKKIHCHYQPCQQQQGGVDYGIFAIAFAVDLCLANDVSIICYDQSKMREHLNICLGQGHFTPFPRVEGNTSPTRCRVATTSFSIFCTCRLPDNGMETMAQCSNCKKWYHVSCQQVPKAVIGTKRTWCCSACSM